MGRLRKYLRPYLKESILAPAFKMLEAWWDLLVPIVIARIIDIGIANQDKAYIRKEFWILVLLAAVGLACSFTAQFFAAKASTGFAADVRQALMDHVESLSYTELDTLGTDTLITRMTSDVQQVQNGLNMGLRLLLRSPFIVFGSMIMALRIDVKTALVFVVAIPVLGAVVFGIMTASIPLFAKVQKGLDDVLESTRENLTGVRVVRAFCREEDEVRAFDEKNQKFTRLNEKVGRLSAAMNPATYALVNIATVTLIYVSAVRVNGGQLTQGSVVALYSYMAQMIVELIKLASLIITINKAIACADRVADVLEVQSGMAYPEDRLQANEPAQVSAGRRVFAPESVSAQTAAPLAGVQGAVCSTVQVKCQPSDTAVEFRDVTFTYAGAGAPALSGISFSAKKGETIGIIGGTGCGKSSLVNLIPRFYDATEGTVLVNGRDVRSYRRGELIGNIGVVPQKAVLFRGSVKSNLKWGNPDASDEQLWQALQVAQAADVVQSKEGKLDFELEQSARNLSGGQKQRLTIARAVVKEPGILILDDSASALDFATDARLRKAIHDMPGDQTVFLVSQRCSTVMAADRILVLDDGTLAGQGTHEQLLETSEVYREIFYSQFPEKKPGNESPALSGKAVPEMSAAVKRVRMSGAAAAEAGNPEGMDPLGNPESTEQGEEVQDNG